MKIYTKTGDLGETGLWGRAGEKRVRKDAVRVEAYGSVDEANAVIGLARSVLGRSELDPFLEKIQHQLFGLGADLSSLNPDRAHRIGESDVTQLEQWIDQWDNRVEPLKKFILPGGSMGAAFLHQARTVVRRAERRVVTLVAEEPALGDQLRYLNRLSDLLFVMARVANKLAGQSDVLAEF